ncbi:hypothetical protein BABINDRAFT_159460 [Babjeviella inositovora NRRL Y-12698]|uniref:Uncharacterized protein n=1 Tax=Babjeviella inositovora NRRL Y-12698 TaxID=984486 RepID=A0A1E3QZE1_9ASCO|nr:uncharacterized protein BABINDRAFT_159460 [Babjeviella inositovora NRRL Y-12698]ODQ82981.1 hypothetical protein BABINDRAFT_159460 [Babjeviella inositovora NRRL Y-12698]
MNSKRQRVRSKVAEPESRADETMNIHDEADVMQFRNIATARFIRNQELLEMVLERQIPLANIIPPAAFPAITPKDAAVTPEDDVWFGDIQRMRQKLAELEAENTTLQAEQTPQLFNDEFRYQRECAETLKSQAQGVVEAQRETEAMCALYQQNFGRRVTSGVQHRNLSHLNPNSALAPPGYVPMLLPSAPTLLDTFSNDHIAPVYGSDVNSHINAGSDMFGNVDMMMEDTFGGLQSTLDDDFLSQINHSME